MAPLLGSLPPSIFINIDCHGPDTMFFLATKQLFHSQVGLFDGTALKCEERTSLYHLLVL